MVVEQCLGQFLCFRTHFSDRLKSERLTSRQLTCRDDHSRPDRIAFAFELQLAARGVGIIRGDVMISLLSYKNFSGSRGSLETSRNVDRIAQYGVVRNRPFTNVADEGFAGGNSGTDVQALDGGQAMHAVHNSKCCLHRSFRMIFRLEWRAEKSHYLISNQFIQSAIVIEDRV